MYGAHSRRSYSVVIIYLFLFRTVAGGVRTFFNGLANFSSFTFCMIRLDYFLSGANVVREIEPKAHN